jgi:transposase InsO family protein
MAQLQNGRYKAVPDNLKELNEYPELKTVAGILAVMQYITALQHNPNPPVPAGYDPHDFRQKFHNTGWRNQIIGHHQYLIYNPPTVTARDAAGHPTAFGPPRINLLVVPPTQAEKQNAMRTVFNAPQVGLGIGVQQFYHQIACRFIGITFEDCNAFLKRQSNYQMTRGWYTRGTNRTLLAGSPNERWECDLLIMTKYSRPHRNRPLENRFYHVPHPLNTQYQGVGAGNEHALHNWTGSWYAILVCVDVFSNYCFACPVITTTAHDICWAMKQICYGQAGCYPRIVQCDNGSEFQTEFRITCEQEIPAHFGNPHPCDVVHTRPHTPTMNSKVERTNGLLRDRFRAGFVRNNSLEWVRHLADYVYNINHSFPSHPESHAEAHNNLSPAELWTRGWVDHRHEDPLENGYDEVRLRSHYSNTMTPEQIRLHTVARKVYLARLNASVPDNHLYRVGDKVRISSLAMFNEVKKRHKAGLEDKLNAVKYLPDVYEVIRVRPDVYNGALAHRLNREGVSSFGTHAWDIKKPEYQLQLFRDEGTGHEYHAGDPNRPPPLRRWYYGSYLQRVFDNMTPPSVTTNHRAFQINRMPGHRYVRLPHE